MNAIGPDTPRTAGTWDELQTSGLLWLINRVLFHPRGWAFGLVRNEDGDFIGWTLMGDGREVWQMGGSEDDEFARAEATLRPREVVE